MAGMVAGRMKELFNYLKKEVKIIQQTFKKRPAYLRRETGYGTRVV
jgi:hypothetical protein